VNSPKPLIYRGFGVY